ncbi:hypothetical protein [Sphingomonas sp.]|nr:hypothetical protein [Sphingomonas sp.]
MPKSNDRAQGRAAAPRKPWAPPRLSIGRVAEAELQGVTRFDGAVFFAS